MTTPGAGVSGVEVTVRPVGIADAEEWIALRDALWPGTPVDHHDEVAAHLADPPAKEACFVAEWPGRGLVGFVEVRLRDYAEDCTSSPVGYLEGIYVVPELRTSGVGRALVAAGEAWARALGCTEMASDREVHNEVSGAFHTALGYQETVRIVCYRKSLNAAAASDRASPRTERRRR